MSDNPFLRFAALGYTRLVPIIPHDATISERSSLHARVGTKQDGRGKTPGIRWRDKTWSGFDWIPYEADERDFHRWHAMGAGVGIKTGDGLVAIDADTTDIDHARIIRDTMEELFGLTPIRIGQFPKALYPLRVATAFPYSRIEFGPERVENGKPVGRIFRVEILSDKRQFVAHGIHPKTGNPYHWPQELVALNDLPIVAPQQLTQLLDTLRERLPDTGEIIREGGTTTVSQASLAGKLDMVRKAITALPNTSDLFPSRESYRDVGYAIKAALPDNETEAFGIFRDWCDRWEEGENDPGVVAADWSRMKPPFRRGAPWLYEMAEQHGEGFSVADVWFDDLDDPANPFAQIDPGSKNGNENTDPNIHATEYDFPDPSAIPRRQMLYGTHYVRQFVSTTAAPTKVGKTSLLIAEALAMASGKPLLGVKVEKPLRVWLWNGEDPIDELRRRVAATMLQHGLTKADLIDERGRSRLFVDSGRDMEIVLANSGRDGTKIAEPVEAAVMASIRANEIDVLSVDPFVSSHRVPENDNGGIDMVAKRWARIADRTGSAIELVHHVRKLNGGEVTIEDARGASALISAARSARALARMTRAEGARMGLDARASRRLFRFADAQSNLALPAPADEAWMELRSVDLGNGGEAGRGDNVGAVCLWEGASFGHDDGEAGTTEADARARLLADVRAGAWRKDPRAGDAWIGHAVARAYKLTADDPLDLARVKALLAEMIKTGVLVEVSHMDENRRPRAFIEAPQTDEMSADIFG
jgi:hypothetical protein